jgi:hypothetical protein
MAGNTSGWSGWSYFAGVMMILIGFFQGLIGFIALFNDEYVILTQNNALFVDITSWAWAHLLLGLIILLAGFGVLSGMVWARTVGVIMALISAVANLAFIPVYPIWSIIVIIVDIIVIYSLIVHGHELRQP